MAHRLPHGCAHPGCPELVRGRARCDAHTRERRAAADASRASAASRGYGHAWRMRRGAFLRRNPLCVVCLASGVTEPATDVDHVVARRAGGSDDPSNLQPLCHRHHSEKTAREDGAFGRPGGR